MIALIAAVAKNGVMGKEGRMPWNIPEEFALFQEITRDATIIMGRRTYDSIGRGMLERKNIVLRRGGETLTGVEVCSSVEQALKKSQAYGKEIFVIGGSFMYKEFVSHAQRMFISWIKKEYDGDVYFPKFDYNLWEVVDERDYDEFTLKEYRRR
jgi:dihydrofolate reductase